jgi:PST family polysaccharide transporter
MLTKIKNIANTEDKKRLLSNFLSLATLQGANYILPLITLPYLVRVLGVEYFGLLAFAGATIAYFNAITDYGFNLTATREISIHRDNKEKIIEIFSSVMTIKVILMFFSFLLLSALVFSFEKFSEHWEVYFLTFGTVVGQVLFPVWFFQGMERMKYITYLNILAKSIFTVAIFIFVHEQSDFWIVPLLTSVGFIIAGILSLWIIKKDFKVNFKFQNIKTLKYYLIDGWDIFVSSFAGNFYRNFNTLVLGILTNNLYVGYYSIAEKIIKVIQSLQNIVGATLFPYLSKKISLDKKYFLTLDKRYFKKILFSYALFSVLVFIFSKYFIYIINGTYDNNIIINLDIMSIVILIGGLNYYYGVLGLVAMNYKKEFSILIIYTAIFNIFTSFLLIYIYDDIGASIAFVTSELFLLMLILNKIKAIKKILND